MKIFCPRCSAQHSEGASECGACALPLSDVSTIVAGGGKRYRLRLAITFLIFFAPPIILMVIGEKVNNDTIRFLAGFLLVLLLPGLPWAVSAVFNRAAGH